MIRECMTLPRGYVDNDNLIEFVGYLHLPIKKWGFNRRCRTCRVVMRQWGFVGKKDIG